MTSAIDATKPADAVPAVKGDMRANFAAAKSEIEALQLLTGQLSPYALSGARNRIHNPLFLYDRRWSGASIPVAAGTLNRFTVDRWYASAVAGGGAFSVQQNLLGPTGAVNAVRITVTTPKASLLPADYHFFTQAIEGNDWHDLSWGFPAAVPVVLSFWVRSSLVGTFSVSLHSAGYGHRNVGTFNITLANVWQYKTVQFSAPTIGTWPVGINVTGGIQFNLGCGSAYWATPGVWSTGGQNTTSACTQLISTAAATFDLAAIQLEAGTIATTFDRRMPAGEIILTGRYFEPGQFNMTGYSTAGAGFQHFIASQQLMKGPAVVTLASSVPVNLTTPTVTPHQYGGFLLSGTVTATGPFAWSATYQADCDMTI